MPRRAGLAASLAAVAFGVASTPALAFWFDYQKPPPPVGGDCAAIASEIGPAATWYGHFAGNYYDDFTDHRYPYSAQGCFKSEGACRRWQNDAVSYTGRGGIIAMSCRRGIRSGY
jgi:hypothetical protein